jgi:hypothetical protein
VRYYDITLLWGAIFFMRHFDMSYFNMRQNG